MTMHDNPHTLSEQSHSGNASRPVMRLAGVISEAWRNLITGTTHACAFALALALSVALLAGADLLAIGRIQTQVDEFVASGSSTYAIDYAGRIDPVACESLASVSGVRAAGALRQSKDRITFAVLPSASVPAYEATEGAIALFADSATGVVSGGGVSGGNAASSEDAASGDAAADLATASSVPGNGSLASSGLWLSAEAADPLHAVPGETIALNDGRQATVGGIYQWPDDGRSTGYSYAALEPVPTDRAERFDSCWVKAWPVPENIESLLHLATVGDASGSVEQQGRAVISQLNTSHGADLDAVALYHRRLTAWAPVVALAVGLLLGAIAIRMRRLELASALHCGVPKRALIAQLMVETCAWLACAMLLESPLLAWVRLADGSADAAPLTDTLLRVPVAAMVGVIVGSALAAAFIREQRLFRYFKNR